MGEACLLLPRCMPTSIGPVFQYFDNMYFHLSSVEKSCLRLVTHFGDGLSVYYFLWCFGRGRARFRGETVASVKAQELRVPAFQHAQDFRQ